MRKNIRIRIILLVCLLLGLANTEAWGQVEYGKYQLKIDVQSMKNYKNGLCKAHFKIYTTKNGKETILKDWETSDIGSDETTPPPPTLSYIYSIQPDIKPDAIVFWVDRGYRKLIGGCKYRDNNGGDTYKINYSKSYIDVKDLMHGDNGNDLFSMFEAPTNIQFHPYEIKLWYSDDTGINQGQLLPMNDVITLKATKGFIPATYKWQYSTDKNYWRDFPSRFQNKDQVTFKGTDLFTEAEFKALDTSKNVHIRIDAVTEKSITSLTLSPSIELPHITNVSYEPETCNGSEDATMLVTLDRALNPGENVYITLDKLIGQNFPCFTEGTTVAKIPGLAAKEYTIGMWGTLNGYKSYSNSTSHQAQLTISPRPAITHSVTATKNVSCINGSDGTISITASGGTGTFLGNLMRDGSNDIIQQVNFATGATGTFTRLKAGTYKINVYDSNGCGNNTTHTVTLSEPLQPVDVTLEYMKQPLAYDSSDGESIIRVNGGTQSANGYTTKFRSESGQSYSPQVSSKDGDSFLYTFKGLHRGKYYITVEDKNFPGLISTDQQIPCGCTDTLSFYLPAPPPQEITIEETHFINCYGSDEGQLTAHAKGGIQLSGGMPYEYTWYRVSESGIEELPQLNDSVINRLITGTYQVKMTDANHISRTSDPFLLIQPDSLSVVFETSDIGCSGNSTGTIKATVSGGTPPYKYQWNVEGETGNNISGLEAGIYMFKVTDERNCQLIATAEIKAPGDLTVDTLITHPSCIAPEGGSIELKLSGATPPYKVVWADNKSTELIRKGLTPGTYYVAISDVNGCSSSYSFTLNKPREFTVKLSEGFTMCYGQARPITATCDEPDVKYEWYCDNTKLAGADSTIVADKAGTYRVVATNPQGCTAEDEVTIHVSRETLNLEFAVPTAIAIGSDIHAVNLSTVSADRIQWHLPEEAQLIKESDTEVVFSIRKKGTYTLSLEGFKGDCSTIVTRTIHVMDKDDVSLPDDQPPLIKQFLVTPNPTTGYFKVMVELNSEEDFTMMLYSPSGVLMDKKEAVKVQNKTFEYEVNGTLEGTYLLHLQTKSDKSVLQIVIKRD